MANPERVLRCRFAVVQAALTFVGLGPDPGEDKEGYQARIWPNDTPFDRREMALGPKKQYSCAMTYEQACRKAGFQWPMAWMKHDIKDALVLSMRERLNGFSPPLYPVTMGNEFFRQKGGSTNLTRKTFSPAEREEFIANALLTKVFLPGNFLVQGLKQGGPPGSVWGKNTYNGEHVQIFEELVEIETLENGEIHITAWVIEGGQPGVKRNLRHFVMTPRGELWATKDRQDLEGDGRPHVGRRVSFIGDLGSGAVSDWWTDLSGDVSPTGVLQMAKYRIGKTLEFAAAHHIEGLPPDHPCSNVHGHSYKMTIELESEAVDDVGFVLDFNVLKTLRNHLDHQDLNKVLPCNPTSENIAKWAAQKLNDLLFRMGELDVKILRVRVSESETSWAEWSSV